VDPNWCYCGHHITQHDPMRTYLCIICGECEGFTQHNPRED
jgi:hypothetical protein